MRKLATVRKIDRIDPIEGADAIEVATVGGWRVVIKRDEYRAGDMAVYCEIDSWIPNRLAPFLSKGKEPREFNGVKGERLRTIKLRGQISQGLLLPMKHLTNWGADLDEGDDVTEVLGIQKWEAPVPAQLAGEVRGNFPSMVPKTDQERVQNLSRELKRWQNLEFEVTEKLDGSSCTMYLDLDGVFHVCSRNLDLKPSETNSFWRAAVKYDVENMLRRDEFFGYAIQGELIGPGIQGNRYRLSEVDFYVYDIYNVKEGRYITAAERQAMCVMLGLKQVPDYTRDVIGYELEVDYLLKMAEGKSFLNMNTEREGIVFKCMSDTDISFKAISNRFLIEGGH